MSTKYNDYKIHTARKGDSVQSICSQYGVTEDDLVKANSHIKLASYGGGFFSSAKLRLDIQAGDKVNIPFYNPEKNKRGVKKITGKNRVKVGVWENYQVAEWYDDTPLEERNEAHVKWDLYLLKNGAKPELVLQKEEGKIRFQEKAIGHNFKVVGYIHEPELDNASSIVVHVEASEKREILKITLSDINNKPITGTLSYGQTINVHVTTTGMKGEYLFLSLWEDDAQGAGHHESNKHNLVAEAKVMVNSKGIAFHQFLLKADFQKIANAYLSKGTSNEGNVHEYYVTAYATGETKASPNVNVRNPEYQQKRKEETKAHLEGTKQPSKNETTQPTNTSIASEIITVKTDAIKVEVAESTSVVKVGESKTSLTKVEALIDAYFAKEEFKKETSETAGQHKYIFQKDNKEVDKKKNEIATIIKKRVDDKVRAEKKYAKLDDIKNALTKKSYAKGSSISFNLYKLGPEYVKINNAPLEEEVFVVAKTVHLDGKEVSIKIKEKEEILVAKDADLKVLEAKENGNEITTLKAKAENGIAKVKIKLRPKSNEDLKTWKEKLKGIKEGTHTYTFGNNGNKTKTDDEKKKIAGIILKKVNESLSSQKKFAKLEDIIKVFAKEVYNKGEQITFDVYKETTEYLWLKAECTGDVKKHEGEFLKRDGAYFMVGKKCECEAKIRAFMRVIRIAEGTGEYIKGTKTARDPQLGYTTWFGGNGNNFKLSEGHPQTINSNCTKTYYSSAAGAYQIMGWKYDELNGYEIEEHNDTYRTVIPKVYTEKKDYAKKYDAKGFSQLSQDRLCVTILNNNGIIKKILKNDISGAIAKSNGVWVSLPGSDAGQPTAKMKETIDYYNEFLKEELAGNSHLHIKPGFLKDFDIKCSCKNESDGKWHDPVDNPIVTIFTQSQSTGEFNDSGKHWGIFGNTRSGSAHAGLDLFAKTGTSIYACVDGTIYNRRWHTSYGNTITIKVKDKEAFLKLKRDYTLQYKDDGEINEGANWSEDGDIFLFYAHLDSVNEYKFNDEVKSGDILGTTGRSGVVGGTCAPHLHFEILCDYTMGVGHQYRLNAGFFVNFKTFDQQTEQEKKDQQTEAKRGKINEVDGQKKLPYENMENFKK